jgi:hypothetical protein
VVVHVRFAAVLVLHVSMRPVRVLQLRVVVLVAVAGREVLPAADRSIAFGAVMCHVHVVVVMMQRLMMVALEPLLAMTDSR